MLLKLYVLFSLLLHVPFFSLCRLKFWQASRSQEWTPATGYIASSISILVWQPSEFQHLLSLQGPLCNVDCWLFFHILVVVVTIYYVKEHFTTLLIFQGYVEWANQPPLSVCKHNLERTHNTFNRKWQINRKPFSVRAQPSLKTWYLLKFNLLGDIG